MARNLLVDDEPVSRPRNLLADEVPIPRQQPDIKDGEGPDRRFDVGKIPESGVYGFLGGLAAPTALKYGGKALQMSPIGQPAAGTLGRGMEVSGEALKGSRLASGISGAGLSAAEESIMQLGNVLGLPEPLSYGLAATATAGAPTLASALLRNRPITRQFLGDVNAGFKQAGERFASRIRGDLDEFDISAQQRVIKALEDEAGRIKQTGQQRANEIMGKAEAEIARLAPGAEAQAAQIRQRARDEAAATLFAARQQADQRAIEIRQIENRARQATQRFEGRVPQAQQAIGQPAEMTDIGNALRERILKVQGDAIAKRKKDYNDGKVAVAEEVAEKESRGDFVRDRADFKAILEEAKQRGGIGKAVLETPQMVAATPQLRSFYKQLFSMLSGKSAQQEIEGKATGALNLDFNQIDEVRRLLGDSFSKPVAEGYTSLQQKAE